MMRHHVPDKVIEMQSGVQNCGVVFATAELYERKFGLSPLTDISCEKKPNRKGLGFGLMVEAAGIEPASASPTLQDLHA